MMDVTLKSVRATERDICLRMPFSYGDVSVTTMSEAQCEVVVETTHGIATGRSAQVMAPRWFNKAPGLSIPASVDELRASVRLAVRHGPGTAGSAARVAEIIRAVVVAEQVATGVPRLAAGFGPALLEAALIDATCRAAGLSFPAAARSDLFGLAPLAPDDLGGAAMRACLDAIETPWSLAVRHTVGYHSPLTAADVSTPPGDWLPVSLEEAISTGGLRWFKIKLKGVVQDDLAWLKAVDDVISRSIPRYRATLDANEQYTTDKLNELLDRIETAPDFTRLKDSIIFVEQPFAREIALSDDTQLPATRFPLIIDESDDSADALPRAFALGWSGTSAKSCKGVFHALVNSARVFARRAQGERAIISAEDLSCQAYLALQQDCLMAMVVGATHVERNGHQFGGALQGYSEASAQLILERHNDLYREQHALPLLRIEGGRIRMHSLDIKGFGSEPDIELAGVALTDEA
jgi:hypothetical protein